MVCMMPEMNAVGNCRRRSNGRRQSTGPTTRPTLVGVESYITLYTLVLDSTEIVRQARKSMRARIQGLHDGAHSISARRPTLR